MSKNGFSIFLKGILLRTSLENTLIKQFDFIWCIYGKEWQHNFKKKKQAYKLLDDKI